MSKKEIAVVIGVLAAAWHIASFIADAKRYRVNRARWRAAPTKANLIRLLVAEGILIKDIGWLTG